MPSRQEDGTKLTPDRYPPGCAIARRHGPPNLEYAATLRCWAGLAKSPPMAIPRSRVLNARPNIPALAPLTIGVVRTCQVNPPSLEWYTRAAAPPLPNHACRPKVVRHSPLAANPISPSSALGMPRFGSTVQLR